MPATATLKKYGMRKAPAKHDAIEFHFLLVAQLSYSFDRKCKKLFLSPQNRR